MASPSVASSQTFAYSSGNAENHLTSNSYFSTIVVNNATTAAVNVCTDGGTATSGAGTHMESVAPGATAAFANLLPLPNANVPGTVYSNGPGIGWQVQKGYQGTNLTSCSVIPQAATSGEVTISFQ